MTREEQIKQLQQSFIDGQQYPITFDKFLWRGKEINRNCLAYALNLVNGHIEKKFLGMNYFADLLNFAAKQSYSTHDVYMRHLILFRLIGVKYKKCRLKTKIPSGYYKVAMLIETGDVHWLRQDEDGTWSHKPGWKYKPQNRDKSNTPILNPEKANIAISGRILEVHYFLIARN